MGRTVGSALVAILLVSACARPDPERPSGIAAEPAAPRPTADAPDHVPASPAPATNGSPSSPTASTAPPTTSGRTHATGSVSVTVDGGSVGVVAERGRDLELAVEHHDGWSATVERSPDAIVVTFDLVDHQSGHATTRVHVERTEHGLRHRVEQTRTQMNECQGSTCRSASDTAASSGDDPGP